MMEEKKDERRETMRGKKVIRGGTIVSGKKMMEIERREEGWKSWEEGRETKGERQVLGGGWWGGELNRNAERELQGGRVMLGGEGKR